jgi:hypothetical protein
MSKFSYPENHPLSKMTEAQYQAYLNTLAKADRNAAQRQAALKNKMNALTRSPYGPEVELNIPSNGWSAASILNPQSSYTQRPPSTPIILSATNQSVGRGSTRVFDPKITSALKKGFYKNFGKGGRRTKKHHKKSHKKSRRSHRHRSA